MTSNELINNNMGLIKKVASKFYNVEKEDLIQVGIIGLLKAYQNYHDNDIAKFSTYAYSYIFGEMYNLVNSNRDLKVSKDLLKIYKLVQKARYEMAQKTGYIPSYEEVALFLELDVNMVYDAINACETMMRLDDEAKEINLYEVIPDKEKGDLDLKLDLFNSLESLNKDEEAIIKYRYFEDLTQSETAKKLNMTQVMVSRYEKKGLEKMRMLMQ